jgi:hypothetical protein
LLVELVKDENSRLDINSTLGIRTDGMGNESVNQEE